MIQRGTKTQSMLLEGNQLGCHHQELSKRKLWEQPAEEGEAWEVQVEEGQKDHCPVTAPDS